mmetsp:Transcript_17873/g.30363  ORF Transcript_17873/g.30363 Transcript_17873/m.30363 type:complete len:526 (+) Transcript_17873:60-1637(+)
MMKKHYLLKKRMKGQIVWEVLQPLMLGGIMRYFTYKMKEEYGSLDQIDENSIFLVLLMPLFICTFVPNVSAIGMRFLIQSLIEDKQNKMRETLRMMSLTQFSYALSFFLLQGFFCLITGLVMGLCSFNDEILFYGDPVNKSIYYTITLMLLFLSQVPFSMTLSAFFNDSKVGSQVGGIILVVPVLIFLQYVLNNDPTIYYFYWIPSVPALQILVSLVTPAFIKQNELLKKFVALNTDYLSIEFSVCALIFDIFLWFFLYLYLDSVIPSEYGIQKHPLFCLRGRRSSREPAPSNQNAYDKAVLNEDDPIKFKGLTKKFGEFTAVNNLSFSIKQGEVFTILGHNGAGKTTAIYMLTGVHKPTGGDAVVYGSSIRTNMDAVQRNLGLCQQFDVLYDNLTVREHLNLICDLKNMPSSQVESTIDETLRVVMLTEHQYKLINQLSGGMKRKLSLAMAIVTRPLVIILDEPTSGLDVESRRQVWELIKRIKVGRSIIMSSQHLEEADELADRILIMSRGQLLSLDKPEMIK